MQRPRLRRRHLRRRYIIRTVLVPAVMHMLGRADWWLPGWLDRTLPQLHVEACRADPAGLLQQADRRRASPLSSSAAGTEPDRGEGLVQGRPRLGGAGQPLTR